MIIHNLNIDWTTIRPREADAELIIDPDAIPTPSVTTQLLQDWHVWREARALRLRSASWTRSRIAETLESPRQTPGRGSVRDRNHSATASSSRLPDAKANILSTTSSSGATKSNPLSPRKMTAAKKEIRLFPSRKG